MAQLAINGGKPVRTELFPAYNTIGPEEKEAVNRVLDSGVLSRYLGCWDDDFYGGPEALALEKEWAAYFNVKHAIAVNSCTSGLICAVGAAGIKPGDEVVVSPYTMSASATAPLWYGGIPVFADIEEEYFCLNPESIEEKITKQTKAIIAVDIFGQPYDADAIHVIAKKHKLIIIEDAAQAPGAKHGDRFTGTLGDIGVFSLNYHKHIHTGEGGVVVTDSDELAERVRLIRNHAEAVVGDKGTKDISNMVGQNYRLTELQAAIAREQLKKLESLNAERIKNSQYLARGFNSIPGLRAASVREASTHVFYQQPIFYDVEAVAVPRERFIEAVRAELAGAVLREHEGPLVASGYVEPLYMLPLFQKKIAFGPAGYPFTESKNPVSYAKGLCLVAERMHEKELFIHEFMRPGMGKDDMDDVIWAFKKVYEHRNELL